MNEPVRKRDQCAIITIKYERPMRHYLQHASNANERCELWREPNTNDFYPLTANPTLFNGIGETDLNGETPASMNGRQQTESLYCYIVRRLMCNRRKVKTAQWTKKFIGRHIQSAISFVTLRHPKYFHSPPSKALHVMQCHLLFVETRNLDILCMFCLCSSLCILFYWLLANSCVSSVMSR